MLADDITLHTSGKDILQIGNNGARQLISGIQQM